MRIDDLRKMIEKDSKIDESNLDLESIKIPMLHAKYYSIFMDESSTLRALDMKYKIEKRNRTEYYLGRAPDQAYIDEPLNLKVMKADLPLYLESDEKLAVLQARRDFQNDKVQMIESFIKSVNNRSFLINNAIKWRMFQNGVSV